MTLEKAFKKAAQKIWKELEPISNNKHKIFEVREEALTTMALKELSKSGCHNIKTIEMISAEDESKKGYDFELAIGNDKTGKYIRFFIQSKRLYGNTVDKSYDAIKTSQANDLIKYAKKEAGLPTYAFYNHLLENDIKLRDYYNSVSFYKSKQLGITLTSAYTVIKNADQKFSTHHYNNGYRVNPRIYSLRAFPHLFSFYQNQKNLAVPFHEISYLTIELSELINRLYRRKQRANTLPLLLLLFLGFEDFFDGDKDLIPITKANSNELLANFRQHADSIRNDYTFSPKALIIIDTEEN